MFFCFWKDPNFLVEKLTNVFVDSAKLLMLKYVQTKISFCQKFENTIIRHVPLKPFELMDGTGFPNDARPVELKQCAESKLGPAARRRMMNSACSIPMFLLEFS